RHRDVQIAAADRLVDDARRAQPRCADLVDGLGGNLLGDAALDLSLAARDLALTGLQYLAEYDLLNLLGSHLGALERGRDGGSAEVGGVERREATAHLSKRRPGGAENHGLGHAGQLTDALQLGCPPRALPQRD